MPTTDRFRLQPYGVAVLSVIVALLLMLALDSVARMTRTPFLLFFGAVVLSAWQGGIRAGLLATALSAAFSNYFFLLPMDGFGLTNSDAIRLLVFSGQGILVSILCGSLRVAHQKLNRSVMQLRENETSLRNAHQRISDILESITDGFFVVDRRWRMIYANPQTERIFGRSQEQLMGASLWDILADARGTDYERRYYEALEKQKPVVFETTGILHPDRYFEINIQPIRDGLAVYFRDLTLRKRDELLLRQHMQMLDFANDSIIIRSLEDDHIVYWNQGATRQYGWPADMAQGQVAHVLLNTRLPEHLDVIRETILEQGYWEGELTQTHRDGREINVSSRWTLQTTAMGQPNAILEISHDITDRKRAEIALRHSESKFHRLIEAGLFGLAIADETGHLTFANEALLALVGYSRQEIESSQLTWQGLTPPEYLERDRRAAAELAETGSFQPFEKEFIHKLGHRVSILLGGALLETAPNEPPQVICFYIDQTERKQAEAALRQSELHFRTLANTMPQMFWTAQPDGTVDYFNQRWYDYTGLTQEQSVGWGWGAAIHPEDLPRCLEAWQASLATGSDYQVEGRFRRAADGQYRWHLALAFPLRQEDGQMIKWFGSCTDIHDQKRALKERDRALDRERTAREEAEAANRTKDEFLAVLSHELRSPLNPILGWISLLRTRRLEEATYQRALETIERNAKLQTQLIEDLLDVSRILRGKLSLQAEPVDLVQMVQAATETVRLSAEAKGMQISLDLDSTVPAVMGDAGRLQQIVWNLVSNAVKFTPDEGVITVRLTQTEEKACIQVQDSGKGIDPEFLPYVFERFRQADSTTTRQFGGLGLGLAIVRYLTELHGGTVHADSQGENQGSTFTVYLPLQHTLAPAAAALPAPQSSPDLSGLRILVVDDDADLRDLLTVVLQDYGAEVETAASASSALVRFDEAPPDVLISDIGMPQMDGYMLIEHIRQRPAAQGGDVPAIALTAYAGQANANKALAAGFQKHLAKPIVLDHLATTILDLVDPQSDSARVYRKTDNISSQTH